MYLRKTLNTQNSEARQNRIAVVKVEMKQNRKRKETRTKRNLGDSKHDYNGGILYA